MPANPFDQFDESQEPHASTNPFDQFDETQQPMAEVGGVPPLAPTSPAAASPTGLDPVAGTATRGFWGGVAEGATDPLLGLAQLGVKAREALGIPTPVSSREAQDFLKAREERIAASRGGAAGMDWPRLAGGAAATAPLAALPGGPVASSLAAGALSGALQPVPEGDLMAEKAKQVGLGATGGAAGAGLVGGLGRLISPKASMGQAAQLAREGITPTPGQALGRVPAVIEEKLTSIPLLGDMIKGAQRRGVEDLNVAAYNRALAPIGEKASGKLGREGVAEVKDKLSAAYERVLPKLNFKADQQFIEEISNLREVASELPEPQLKQFEKILQNKLFHRMPTGTMDGQTFKGVDSELSRLAKGYMGDASFDNRQMGTAIDEVLRTTRNALERSNPDAQELQAINRGYATYARIRDAASRVGSDQGVFSPAQLQAAVRAGDKSVGKGAFATGQAPLQDLADPARAVLGSKYPDSGTAGRGLLGLLAGGGLAYVNPYAAGAAGAAMLPYTRAGQKAFEYGLLRRPAAAAPVGRALGMLSPLGAPIGGTVAGGMQ